MRSLRQSFVLSLALVATPALAVEGMWQPKQLPEIAAGLRAAGLAIDPQKISALDQYPANAIVSLGFCSASFVSPKGLVVTNHHCAYGAIQFNSTGERNLLADGFLANDFAEELPGDPSLRVYVTEEIRDVTDSLRAAQRRAGKDDRAIYDAVDRESKRLVRDCEADGQHRCDVYIFHGGKEFSLIRQLEIKDVRLVYAPPEAIGKFGGDVDNWMWPRHTGDFSFLRAYVGRDGKPAPYSKDNVPYAPKSFLKVNPKGLSAGDFNMVLGYPGRTNRWRFAEELNDAITVSYPRLIADYAEFLRVIEAGGKGRPDAAVKYASTVASLNNTMKNLQGQLEGFARIDGVAMKQADEQGLRDWLAAEKQTQTLQAIDELHASIATLRGRAARDWYFGLIAPTQSGSSGRLNREGSPISAALDIYRFAIERDKPDARREYGYQDRDRPSIQARLETFDRRFDPAIDRALLKFRVERYASLPAAERLPELDGWLGISGDKPDLSGVDARLDAFYAGTRLTDAATRLAWFGKSRREIEASDDTALRAAVALYPAVERIETQYKEATGKDYRLRPQYMQAMIDFQARRGRAVYPDANRSLRVTYGTVQGYSPREAISYAPFTSLKGVAEKTRDTEPFNTPKAQREAIAARRYGSYAVSGLDSVPVNFMSDLDITGGNSGSSTLDKNAELVGLAFDGNWESVSASWIFNPALTRSIHVDIRYMLWVMDEIDHAERLIREMGLTPASP